MTLERGGHDIIVIGASAGGLEALTQIVGGLPAELSASIFVVLHIPPDSPSALATILGRAGSIPAVQANDQQRIEPGLMYVAPPNRHLVLHRGRVRLRAGPRENSARPAIDVLFRSAARTYGRRVVGIVLSGTLRDGALGLAAIKTRGGVTMVQDPGEALFAGMPENALKAVPVDYCLRAAQMPTILVELSQLPLEQQPTDPARQRSTQHTLHPTDEPDQPSPKLPNAASGLTCPECHGSLWELKDDARSRFECSVGHAYSLDALSSKQGEAAEAALWSAVNALEERAATFRRLGGGSSGRFNQVYFERAELTERQSGALLDLLRRLIADDEIG